MTTSFTSSAQAVAAATALRVAQQQSFRAARTSTADERRLRLHQVIAMLMATRAEIADALDADFGGRHPGYSLTNDVLGSLAALNDAALHLESWMQAQPRTPFSPYDLLGASAEVRYQAKGSIAIIGTWNAPVFTLFAPLAGVLAAGNRAVLKPSESVPRTAQVLADAVAAHLDPLQVGVVTGGPEVAIAMTAEPYDHIVFTGSGAAGRSVMVNAAQNLVPVTLELGGKSPVVIGRTADLATAAFRIAVGKGANAGQMCVSPDTVHVPANLLEDFVSALRDAYTELYPTAAGNQDLTAVVNDRHLARVEGYLSDAAQRGVRVETSPAEPSGSADRRRPLGIVVDPPAEATISQEEIFGPAVVVRGYTDLGAVIAEINAGPAPLALYYFGQDAEEREQVIEQTTSGGVTVNEVMMHPGMLDAPFGGVGASGMGHYNGREGFLEFSHARTVFVAGENDPRREWGLLPPHAEDFRDLIDAQFTI